MNTTEDLTEDDEELIAPAELVETDMPCRECGDESNVHLHDSRTFDRETGKDDPQIALCVICAPGHHAFYDSVDEDAQEALDKEDDESEIDA